MPHRRPSPTATAAVLAAPALLAAAELLSPTNTSSDTAEQWYADVMANSGRYQLTAVALLAGLLLLVPAVLTVHRIAATSAPRAATVGAALAAAGAMLFAVNLGAVGVGVSAWTTLSPQDQSGALPAFVAMDEGKGLMPIVQLGAVLPTIGLAVLAVTLWRAGTYPRWGAATLGAGWMLFLFSPVNEVRAL
jgi:uncharacterized membrane protein HdeD (DUF308 family)